MIKRSSFICLPVARVTSWIGFISIQWNATNHRSRLVSEATSPVVCEQSGHNLTSVLKSISYHGQWNQHKTNWQWRHALSCQHDPYTLIKTCLLSGIQAASGRRCLVCTLRFLTQLLFLCCCFRQIWTFSFWRRVLITLILMHFFLTTLILMLFLGQILKFSFAGGRGRGRCLSRSAVMAAVHLWKSASTRTKLSGHESLSDKSVHVSWRNWRCINVFKPTSKRQRPDQMPHPWSYCTSQTGHLRYFSIRIWCLTKICNNETNEQEPSWRKRTLSQNSSERTHFERPIVKLCTAQETLSFSDRELPSGFVLAPLQTVFRWFEPWSIHYV